MSEVDNTATVIRKFETMLEGLTFHELTVLNRMVVDRVRVMQKAGTLMFMSKFHVGDRVSWDGNDGTVRTGIIIRLNQKSVSVKTGNEGHWNVPPHLLWKESR
jgi:hypothetical protein